MKQFASYRNIRKQALIFGLSISLFAVMMLSIIGSLLVMIFSFHLVMVLVLIIGNSLFYVLLLQFMNRPQLFQKRGVYPQLISNKQISGLDYEKS
jgi:hypothetical protein